MAKTPVALIIDEDGNFAVRHDTETVTPATQPVLLVAGVDGTTIRTIRLDSAGRQKMQADALPLPAGAATETKLETVRALLATIDADTSNLDVLLSTRATEATLAAQRADIASLLVNSADIETILTAIRDSAGIKKITDQLPAGTNEIGKVKQGTKAALKDAWPTVLTDDDGNAFSSSLDVGVRRQEIAGKVSIVGASPPPATNSFSVFADTPLIVGSADSTFVIPTGETLHVQQMTAGNESPLKGSSVEIIYDENGVEHLVIRIYLAGFSALYGFADVNAARDGTALVGNIGGTNKLIVRRLKFSGPDIAIDAYVSGYTV